MREMNFDAVIIGGGVVGCAIARELSRYDLRACVVEREEDVCSGTSKANSAIVHAGHDAVPGSLKARFNVEGNRMMEELAGELDFDFKRNGSLVLCFDEKEKPGLEELYEKDAKTAFPACPLSAETRPGRWSRTCRTAWWRPCTRPAAASCAPSA